ncbi:MAG: hypothetical protein FWH25_03245, partial [Syntrophorhabdaceae bacterium]|nr:hypothetical protein [Syntrophorhabdaceae bacterium]
MNVREIVESLVSSAAGRKLEEWGEHDNLSFQIEMPRQESHGDFSSNAAMQIARRLGKKPRSIAEELVAAIKEEDAKGLISSLEIAGPGFINIFLSKGIWAEVVTRALTEGERFGSSDIGAGETILLEFVS